MLRTENYLHSDWDVADLYLGSIGAKCLNGDPPYLVGMSQGTTCYVSTAYFDEDDPFTDFVVHEAAYLSQLETQAYWAASYPLSRVAARNRFFQTRAVRLRLRGLQ